MKIIDLLNKIANGEMPQHIKYKGMNLYWNKNNYAYDIIEEHLEAPFYLFNYEELNDEIEIIEEPKKIEKLLTLKHSFSFTENEEALFKNNTDILDKLNEIIDYINKENK